MRTFKFRVGSKFFTIKGDMTHFEAIRKAPKGAKLVAINGWAV